MPEIGTEPRSDDQSSASFQYSFGPFRFDSEIEIPELRELNGTGDRAVSIRLGGVPTALASGFAYGKLCQVGATEYLLKIPNVARFFVSGGEQVWVEPAANVSVRDMSVYLMGSVFGALCHQNGLLPLHASSVEAGGAATAFLGDSGAGKSTLAACLQGRGYRVVSDDICVLEGERVIPVAGWLKLWRASLDHLGQTPEEANRIYSADEKYRLYLPESATERPRLANVVFLTKAADQNAAPKLIPLSAAEAIAQMLRLTYLGYITELTGSHERVFRRCAQALQGAKAFKLAAPWGLERMEETVRFVEAELF